MRAHILHSSMKIGNNPKLVLLLSATDMLAACAEGKNLFIESVCRNIYSLEELIDLISSQLPPLRKKPFTRFLIHVYMMTADNKNENRNSSLKHHNIIWIFLEKLANYFENITLALKHVPLDKHVTIKQELKEVMRNRSKSIAFSLRRPKLLNNSPRVSNIIGDDGSLKPGLLEYLVDGILPLLHTYYYYYFSPEDAPSERYKSREILISAQIFDKLVLLQSELENFFTIKSQVELFQNTIQCFKKFPEVAKKALASVEDVEKILQMSTEFLDSSEPEQYAEQYNLNREFHRYCDNYYVAYKGPNIAQHQIGLQAITKEYNDPGEELPLGPRFQSLINLYSGSKNSDEHDNPSSEENKPIRCDAEYILNQLEVARDRKTRLSEAEQEKQDILVIRCLQVLRGLIHNKVKLLDPEEKERKPIEYREKSMKLFVPVQNQIQTFGINGIQKVIPLLSHSKPTIAQEALSLIKAMLFSGNKFVLEGIERSVKQTREEKLFLNLKNFLEDASQNYQEMILLQKQLSEKDQNPNEHEKQNKPPKSHHASPSKKRPFTLTRSMKKNEVHIMMESLGEDDRVQNEDEALSSDQASLESILQQDNNWITLVLEVIGLMCDGQNRVLQNYLRDQPDNFKTVNVVSEVANILHVYTRDLVRTDWRQINQVLQTLIEMCVGNTENQLVIYDAVIIEPLNRLLELQINHEALVLDHCTKEFSDCCECKNILLLVKVKGSIFELLETMLEETTQDTAIITEGIGYTINFDAVLNTMETFHKLQLNPLIIDKEMDDDCERGMFRGYNIVTCLHKAITPTHSIANQMEEWKKKIAFTKCVERKVEVEIHYECDNQDSILAAVQFPFNSEDKLRKEVKELVRWSINRDSMGDKHRAFLALMDPLKADMKHQEYLQKKPYWKPFISFHKLRYLLLLFLTFVLNIFIFFVYRVPEKSLRNNESTTNVDPFLPAFDSWFSYVLYILGSVHLFLSVWMAIEYFVINWPHFRLPKFFYTYLIRLKKLKKSNRSKKFKKRKFTCLDVNIFGVMTIYVIVFVACSILSLGVNGFFYPICLLYIIVNNDLLQRVLRAVTKNGYSLILVGILGIIILFIYAVASYAFLHNFFISTSNGELYCNSVAECMYSILRFGLLDNIGLLLPLNTTTDGSEANRNFQYGFQYGRLIFDLSFFILIITIGLNVVFGIIVDTFSQLREERSNVVEDEKSTCFICNLPSHEFDRKGNGFKDHINKEHNMWNYVYYSLHLERIDTGDHNAIQKYVYQKIKEDNTSFFPQEEAKCLSNIGDSSDTVMTDLVSKVEMILKHFNQKAQQKSEKEKQKDQEQWDLTLKRGTTL